MSNLSNCEISFIIFSPCSKANKFYHFSPQIFSSHALKALTNIGLLWGNVLLTRPIALCTLLTSHSCWYHFRFSPAVDAVKKYILLWFQSGMLLLLLSLIEQLCVEKKIYDFALFLSKWNKPTVKRAKTAKAISQFFRSVLYGLGKSNIAKFSTQIYPLRIYLHKFLSSG